MSDNTGMGPAPGGADNNDGSRSPDHYGQHHPGHNQPGQEPQSQYPPSQYPQSQYGQDLYPQNQYGAPGQVAASGYQTPPGQPGPAYGNSGQQSWQHIAPEHVARMYQPGVIPLRPLKLGDIFGGSINTIRRNPEATIGMAVIVLGTFLLPSLLISFGISLIPGLDPDVSAGIAFIVPTLISIFPTLVLAGFILYVVSEAALGEKVGLGQTWRAVRGRIPALIGVSILTSLITIVVISLGLALLVVSIALRETVVIVLGVVAFLVSILLAIWIGVRLILSSAPVVLEGTGPFRALRRSWGLSTGSQFWRLLGITLLAAVIANIVGTALGTPFNVLFSFAPAAFVESESAQLLVAIFGQHLAQFLVGLIITPFTAGVTALLYLDQRIRREALDITMQQAATQRAAERSQP